MKLAKLDELNDSAEYFLDSILDPDLANEKAAAALDNGDPDYFFASVACEKRPEMLVKLRDRLSDEDFWHYVRKFWAQPCYTSPKDSETLLTLMHENRGESDLLMSDGEKATIEKLPEMITVYFGCSKERIELGWSWSLSEEIGRMYAANYRSDGDGIIIRGTCPKRKIVAYFNIRPWLKQEIVVDAKYVSNLFQRKATFRWAEELDGRLPWQKFTGEKKASAFVNGFAPA
jgi:hypothetical protein